MSIKWKLMAAIVGPLALAIGLVAWKAGTIIEKQNLLGLEEDSNQQLSQLRSFIEERIQGLRERLGEIAEAREAEPLGTSTIAKTNRWNRRLRPFVAAGVYVRSEDGRWKPRWILRSQQQGDDSMWSDQNLGEALQRLPFSSVRPGDNMWWSIVDPEQRRHFVMLTPINIRVNSKLAVAQNEQEGRAEDLQASALGGEGSALPSEGVVNEAEAEEEVVSGVAVGLIQRGFLNETIAVYKGSAAEVFLVDGQGYILAHPVVQNWGVQVSDNEVVAELMRTNKTSGVQFFSGLDGRRNFGRFVNLDRSNLYAVWSAPLLSDTPGMPNLVIKILVLGIIIMVLGVVLSLLLSTSLVGRLNKVQMALFRWAREGGPLSLEVNGTDEVGRLAYMLQRLPLETNIRAERLLANSTEQEALIKKEAYRKIGTGLCQEILGPITLAIGNLQILKAKVKDDDGTKEYLQIVEKETRRVRDTIEKLGKMVGSAVTEKQLCDVTEILLAALAEVRPAFNADGIKIIKDFSQSGEDILANRSQLLLAFVNILEFSRLSMKDSNTKILTMTIEKNKERVEIRFIDTGPGMSPVEILKVFDPFSGTTASGDPNGLSMAFAQGIVQEHLGLVDVRSKVGEGSQLIVELPVHSKLKRSETGYFDGKVDGATLALDRSAIEGEEHEITRNIASQDLLDENENTVTHFSPASGLRRQEDRILGEVTKIGIPSQNGASLLLGASVDEEIDLKFPQLPTEVEAELIPSEAAIKVSDIESDSETPSDPAFESGLEGAKGVDVPRAEPTKESGGEQGFVINAELNLNGEVAAPPSSSSLVYLSEDEKSEVVDQVLKKIMNINSETSDLIDNPVGDLIIGEDISPPLPVREDKRSDNQSSSNHETEKSMQVPKNSELENENEVDVLQIALEEATGMRSKSGKPRTKIAPKFPADEPLSITQEMLDMVGEVNFPGFEEEYKAENVQNQNSPNGQNPENFIRLRRPKLKRDE